MPTRRGPLIWRLCIGDTGTTRRPSRITAVASASKYPLSIARDITLRITDDIDAWVCCNCRRISPNSADALSFISPKRSMLRLIVADTLSNRSMPSAISSSVG